MIQEITNHIQDAKRRLAEQYKGKPNIAALIESLLVGFQGLETTAKDLNEDRSIDTAQGELLDLLGTIVGLERAPGQSDTDYRVQLKSKISQNISQGEPERLIDVYKTLVMASFVYLSEHYPGGFGLGSSYDPVTNDQVNRLFRLIEGIAPAGVRMESITVFDETEPFAFDGAISGLGFGTETDPGLGGLFATLYTPYREFAFAGDDSAGDGFGTIHDPLLGGNFLGL